MDDRQLRLDAIQYLIMMYRRQDQLYEYVHLSIDWFLGWARSVMTNRLYKDQEIFIAVNSSGAIVGEYNKPNDIFIHLAYPSRSKIQTGIFPMAIILPGNHYNILYEKPIRCA